MRPLLWVTLVVLAVLLVLLIAEMTEDSVESDSVRVVAQWGSEKPDYIVHEDMFTTTTTARPRTAPTERRTMRAASAGPARPARYPTGCTVSGGFDPAPCVPASRPCAIPAYICARESQGRINVWNHQGSGASGKYQAMPGTWGGYGGYQYAAWAPEEVQDEWAAKLWNSPGGPRHWNA